MLRCAVEARQPIGIFEIPERSVTTMIPLLYTPLYVAVATPFIRPFRWRRLLWTYALPLVPLTCRWEARRVVLEVEVPVDLVLANNLGVNRDATAGTRESIT